MPHGSLLSIKRETAMHKQYVIHGDLTRIINVSGDRQRVWDALSEFRTHISIDLQNQHNANHMFSGPIGIVGTFYMKFPKDIPRRKRPLQAIHTRKPTMSSLIYFLEHIGFGVLFGNTTMIASVEARKFYTIDTPRVEMQIFTIDN